MSIKNQVVPENLKYAIVKPLHKKNSRLEVGNYRPVSILSIVSKIMERAVYDQIMKHLKDYAKNAHRSIIADFKPTVFLCNGFTIAYLRFSGTT